MALTWKEAIEVIDFPYNWGNREVILDVIRRTVSENQEFIDKMESLGYDTRKMAWRKNPMKTSPGELDQYASVQLLSLEGAASRICPDYYTCLDFLANYEPPGGTREIYTSTEVEPEGKPRLSGISWDNGVYIGHVPTRHLRMPDGGYKITSKYLDDCKDMLKSFNVQPDGTYHAASMDYRYLQSVGYDIRTGMSYDGKVFPFILDRIGRGGYSFSLRNVPSPIFNYIYGTIGAEGGRESLEELEYPNMPHPERFLTLMWVDWFDKPTDMNFHGISFRTTTILDILEIAAAVDEEIKTLYDKYKGVKQDAKK